MYICLPAIINIIIVSPSELNYLKSFGQLFK